MFPPLTVPSDLVLPPLCHLSASPSYKLLHGRGVKAGASDATGKSARGGVRHVCNNMKDPACFRVTTAPLTQASKRTLRHINLDIKIHI